MDRKNGVLQGNRDQKWGNNRDIDLFKLLLPMIFLIKNAILLVIGLLRSRTCELSVRLLYFIGIDIKNA
jgi:hypothetical protein